MPTNITLSTKYIETYWSNVSRRAYVIFADFFGVEFTWGVKGYKWRLYLLFVRISRWIPIFGPRTSVFLLRILHTHSQLVTIRWFSSSTRVDGEAIWSELSSCRRMQSRGLCQWRAEASSKIHTWLGRKSLPGLYSAFSKMHALFICYYAWNTSYRNTSWPVPGTVIQLQNERASLLTVIDTRWSLLSKTTQATTRHTRRV